MIEYDLLHTTCKITQMPCSYLVFLYFWHSCFHHLPPRSNTIEWAHAKSFSLKRRGHMVFVHARTGQIHIFLNLDE